MNTEKYMIIRGINYAFRSVVSSKVLLTALATLSHSMLKVELKKKNVFSCKKKAKQASSM